jgi:hypothetical protein
MIGFPKDIQLLSSCLTHPCAQPYTIRPHNAYNNFATEKGMGKLRPRLVKMPLGGEE